ncbi:MAG: TVP38/TMEM64 family protein [Candidatus Eisenbacteria bacterium]|uniref:TVP38/TMEM64 family membrane protein n=1 Tax=Eiseniibacteriota bacterium TaxID=2212470 RepID=A0A538T7F3_UNCEI|nr:MAG: TVP38/TMEM64 family protein [Candidatus Eisenbacteria bacterium]
MPRAQTHPRFTWIHGILLAAVVAALVWIGIESAPFFTRPRLEGFLRGAGHWGPLILLGLQIAQILVAPIPGVFMPILAGALYGPVVGVLIASVGTLVGSSAAYAIGSRAGLPLLKRWVGTENVDRANAIVGGKRWLALVPIFLVPFSPADAICFVAGMIGIDPSRFFLSVLIGRLPKDCALALAGAGLIRLGSLVAPSG